MENSKCNFVGRNVIGSLAILVIFIAFLLPSQSEAAFIPLSSSSSSSFSSSVSSPSPPSSNSSKKANADKEFEHQVLQLLSHGDKPENIAEDEKLREKILQEISDTAMSIEDLGYLLQVVRAKNVKSRERRQQGRGLVMSNRRCRFIEFSNEEVMGTCFYDFGGYIACKSGNNLSFDAAECPRRPDRYAG